MRISLSSSISALRTSLKHLGQAVARVVEVTQSSIRELAMALAPLRRVVRREIEVFRFHRERPEQFVIHDQLECGHTFTDFQWGFMDLVNPHSEVASKKRHRCRECAAVIAKREPQSVRSYQRERMA